MQNALYTYPQSSCECYKCTNDAYNDPRQGPPNNLGVKDGYSRYFNCAERLPFKEGIEPKPLNPSDKPYFNINPKQTENKYDKTFIPVSCSKKCNGSEVTYSSSDPRLVSVAHGGQILKLDRPPLTSEVKLANVYDESMNAYGRSLYSNYYDINAGQIEYYIDRTQEDAFFQPNFSTSAQMVGTMYKDPMGAMKPQYDRYPITCSDHLNTKRKRYDGSLSWIRDSEEHRQDLLSRQMRKINEQRWSPRWT